MGLHPEREPTEGGTSSRRSSRRKFLLFKTVMWHLAQHVLIFTSFHIEFHTVFRWVLFLTFLQPCFHGFSCYFTNYFSCLAFFDCPLFRPSNLGLFGVLLKRARAK